MNPAAFNESLCVMPAKPESLHVMPDFHSLTREFAGQIAALALDSLDLFQYTWGFVPLAASCSLGDEAIKVCYRLGAR